jgi:hypothetical protein
MFRYMILEKAKTFYILQRRSTTLLPPFFFEFFLKITDKANRSCPDLGDLAWRDEPCASKLCRVFWPFFYIYFSIWNFKLKCNFLEGLLYKTCTRTQSSPSENQGVSKDIGSSFPAFHTLISNMLRNKHMLKKIFPPSANG